MITEEQYQNAVKQIEKCQKIIHTYYKEQQELFEKKIKDNYIFNDNELNYSAMAKCQCGHGLAYPKGCTIDHYWDCSAILKGIADPNVEHTDKLPFMFYKVKSESKERGTTRKSEGIEE